MCPNDKLAEMPCKTFKTIDTAKRFGLDILNKYSGATLIAKQTDPQSSTGTKIKTKQAESLTSTRLIKMQTNPLVNIKI